MCVFFSCSFDLEIHSVDVGLSLRACCGFHVAAKAVLVTAASHEVPQMSNSGSLSRDLSPHTRPFVKMWPIYLHLFQAKCGLFECVRGPKHDMNLTHLTYCVSAIEGNTEMHPEIT